MVTQTPLFMTLHDHCLSCYLNKDRIRLDSSAIEPDIFYWHSRGLYFLHFGDEKLQFSRLLVNKNWDKLKLISCILIVFMFVGADRAMAPTSQGGSRVQIPAQSFVTFVMEESSSWQVYPVVPSDIFHWHNPSGRTMALGSTQPLTEMSTRNIQAVSKRALQLWKLIEIYTEDIHNVLNCQNVAKHTEFYLG